MKIWSVFSLVILFHLAVIGLLLIQPGCQSQPADRPQPAQTRPVQQPSYTEPQQPSELDPAFNSGMATGSTSTSSSRQLSAPTRPETVQRSAPDTGLLQPVTDPATDTFSLPPVTREYTVKKGDTLSGIARRQGVSLSELLSANGLNRSSTIYVGQTLFIPESFSSEDSASTETEHSGKEVEVRRGDTLSAIAARNNTTIGVIKTLNGMTSDTIYVGQKLVVPDSGTSSGTASSASSGGISSMGAGMTTYTVKAGDTPSGIARQFGITSRQLMAANNITDPRKLYVGRKLVVPGGSSNSNTRNQTSQPVSRQPSMDAPSRPSRETDTTSAGSTPLEESPEEEEDPMAALEALEDEDLPFVEVEIVDEENEPTN